MLISSSFICITDAEIVKGAYYKDAQNTLK